MSEPKVPVMVERVARVITGGGDDRFPSHDAILMARAVIEAMQELPLTTIRAGNAKMDWMRARRRLRCAEHIWRAMIDAALRDE